MNGIRSKPPTPVVSVISSHCPSGMSGCIVSTAYISGILSNTAEPTPIRHVDLESAARKSDEAKICTDLLATDLISTMRSSGQSCTQAISHALDDADTFDLTVKSVTVSGNTATAIVQSKRKTPAQDTFKLVKEGGRWKIASLGA